MQICDCSAARDEQESAISAPAATETEPTHGQEHVGTPRKRSEVHQAILARPHRSLLHCTPQSTAERCYHFQECCLCVTTRTLPRCPFSSS